MPKLDSPLLLSPEFKAKIWGRASLDPLYPRPGQDEPVRNPAQEARAAQGIESRIGEVWLTGDGARFLSGPVAGLTLGEVSRRWPAELWGPRWNQERFPILAKFLFTDDWLSVQVHPDDEYAEQHEGSAGKAEMCYFLRGGPEAVVGLGLKPGTTREGLAAACVERRSRELLQTFHPDAGEAAYTPPGTVHALGPGLVLFEAGENSDITYRLDDYGRVDENGRPRQLHLERGLQVVRPELSAFRLRPKIEFPTPFGAHRYVVACPHFAVEEMILEGRVNLAAGPERVETLVVVAGEGRVEVGPTWLAYRTGQTWLVPPGVAEYRLVPEEPTCLFRLYVPDLEEDFRRPLARLGVSQDTIRQVVFGD